MDPPSNLGASLQVLAQCWLAAAASSEALRRVWACQPGRVNSLIGISEALNLRESCMRENCTCSLRAGRRPARKRASYDPTELLYRRLVPRLGYNKTIGAIAHRLCRLIWIILHCGVRYEERRQSVNAMSRQWRTRKMILELRRLGYRVEPVGTPA
jgi:hypothetical protein